MLARRSKMATWGSQMLDKIIQFFFFKSKVAKGSRKYKKAIQKLKIAKHLLKAAK